MYNVGCVQSRTPLLKGVKQSLAELCLCYYVYRYMFVWRCDVYYMGCFCVLFTKDRNTLVVNLEHLSCPSGSCIHCLIIELFPPPRLLCSSLLLARGAHTQIKPPSKYNIEYNRVTTILNKNTEYRQIKNLNFFDIDDCKPQTGFTYWELKAG